MWRFWKKDKGKRPEAEEPTAPADEAEERAEAEPAEAEPAAEPPEQSEAPAEAELPEQQPPAEPERPEDELPQAPAAQAEPQADEQPPAEAEPEAEPAAEPAPVEQPARKPGLFARLKAGLSRTGSGLTEGLSSLFLGKKVIDDELLEELETRLLMADVGVEATERILDGLTARLKRNELNDVDALLRALQEDMLEILAPCSQPLELDAQRRPFVILMVGVNGAGKTTTIGKLARRYRDQGKNVLLAAGDTFRAAAVEQLQAWGQRAGIPVIAQHTGADSASVVFDALQAAQARGSDLLIADTAGRLHTQSNLMEELKKVKRVMGKLDPDAPHETLLVVDASNGQNALAQAKQFHEAVGVDGVVITKLDGTAKGGVIFAIAEQLKLPVRFIGVGESAEDLRPFDARDFVQALLSTERE